MNRYDRYAQTNQLFRQALIDAVKAHGLKALAATIGLGVYQTYQTANYEAANTPEVPCITSLGTPIPPNQSLGPDKCVHAYKIGDTTMSSVIFDGTSFCLEARPGIQTVSVARVGGHCVGYEPTPDVNE